MAEQDSWIIELIQTLSAPEKSALPLILSGEPSVEPGSDTTRQKLRNTCQFLFGEIESLNKQYHNLVVAASKSKNLNNGDNVDVVMPSSLSGLEELYLGDVSAPVDAETLWGQVDLQTTALMQMLKKSTKKLSKAADKENASDQVRLLDMAEEASIREDDMQQDDDDVNDEDEFNDEDDTKNEDDDEETRRINERMERVMGDMDAEDDDEEDDEDDASIDNEGKARNASTDEEALVDPAAEELNDGFFDINEMEGFADEEEEYLPEDAFGTVRPENDEKGESKTGKKSFHQKQREGLIESDDDDDDNDDEHIDEEDEVDFASYNQIRRKKYRDDADIEALYNLYETPDNDDDDDIINMTAADFFGQPNKKDLQKRKRTSHTKSVADDDADSWDEYGFNNEGVGWRDEGDRVSQGDENVASDDEDVNHGKGDDDKPEHKDLIEGAAAKSKSTTKKAVVSSDKLEQQIEQLEQEMIREKPWQMTGETKGTSRPLNSLLEVNPEFEVASKQAPLITIEHTENLEEVIKRRILAEDWDDVIPRELPDVGWKAKRGELPEVSQEKSKLSLGELYEREYLKKAVGYDVDAAEKQTAEEQTKGEIRALFANLCSKLDALSNYHFAPRPVAEEADVKSVSTPAIAMEEVLPLHVSNASAVAPEEVFGTKRGRESELKGESELDQVERKRLRASKKTARRKRRKEKLADEKLISRLQPGQGLNNPYEKRKMREELSMARSRGKLSSGAIESKAEFGGTKFFKKLQQEAKTSINSDAKSLSTAGTAGSQSKTSSEFKL